MLLRSFSCLVLHFFVYTLSPQSSLPFSANSVPRCALFKFMVPVDSRHIHKSVLSFNLFSLALHTCAPYWYANTLPTTVRQSFSAPIDVIIWNVDAFQYTWVIAIFIQNECIQKSNPLLSTILTHLHTSTSHAITYFTSLHLTLPLHSSLHYTFYKSTALYSKCTV